jgi:sterol desaturase/sphingolipid hydroxylase (fatty acid hydroxylase superfamily)
MLDALLTGLKSLLDPADILHGIKSGLIQLVDLKMVAIMALAMIFIERVLPRIRPEQPIIREKFWLDATFLYFNRILVWWGVMAFIAVTGVVVSALVPLSFHGAVRAQPLWLQAVEATLVAELVYYTLHRLFHEVPFLWRFHAVHHSSQAMDWLAAYRVHPLDQALTKGLSYAALYGLGFSPGAMAVYTGLFFWVGVFNHCNIRVPLGPVRWIVATPQYHHWHHADDPAAYNTNYAGTLPLFDVIFRTAYLPGDRMPDAYGISDPVPSTYLGALRWPFWNTAPK